MPATPITLQRPPEAADRGLVVVQEAFGVNDHIQAVAESYAAEGWVVAAPHLFHRTGDPVLSYEDIPSVMPHLQALTADGIRDDIAAALDALTQQGITAERTAVIGYCMGGSVALVAGADHALGAAVTYYGGGVVAGRFGFSPLVELAPRLQTPWLGLYGAHDETIPIDEVHRLELAAKQASVETEVTVFDDAGHGFNCDRRDSFHEEAARAARQQAAAWLERHVPLA